MSRVMSGSFSERQGITKPISLDPNTMPMILRNRIWNVAQKHIDRTRGRIDREDVIGYLWDRFFKEDIDSLEQTNNFDSTYYHIDQIKEKFYKLKWNEVYDFLEFLLDIEHYEKDNFINSLNFIFIDEGAQYKIIDGMITPLISGEEAVEVEKAIEHKHAAVSRHIQKALEFYRKRPAADYQNSIKESISAVEALAKIVLNKPSATLGAVAEQLNLHPAFQKAIKELYGWTSDEGGIRHSENGKELKIDEKEARYMLIQCSAIVNYIVSKYEN